jgi:hypothetical protein
MLELQEIVAVPLLVNDVFVIELQLSPGGTLAVSVKLLVNPWIRLTAIVDVVDEPTLTLDGEDAEMVKSGGIPNVNEAVEV